MIALLCWLATASVFPATLSSDVPSSISSNIQAGVIIEDRDEVQINEQEKGNIRIAGNDSLELPYETDEDFILATGILVESAEKSAMSSNVFTITDILPNTNLSPNSFSTLPEATDLEDTMVTSQNPTRYLSEIPVNSSNYEYEEQLNFTTHFYSNIKETTEGNMNTERNNFKETVTTGPYLTSSETVLMDKFVSEENVAESIVVDQSEHLNGTRGESGQDLNLPDKQNAQIVVSTTEMNDDKNTEAGTAIKYDFTDFVGSDHTEVFLKESTVSGKEDVTLIQDFGILSDQATNKENETASAKEVIRNFNEKYFAEYVTEKYLISKESEHMFHREYPQNFTDMDGIIERNSTENAEELYLEATEENANSTRVPKRIQGRYPEGRVRPYRPDPGYANRQDARPYRPESSINQNPYYRPTPDYRTPVIREHTNYSRPGRPDSEYQRASFRPYSFSRPSQDEVDSSQQSSTTDSGLSRPYRPAFNKPYVPQNSFGMPYRPDYHHKQSPRPLDEFGVTAKQSTEYKGSSYQETDILEFSRADFDYTGQSEPGYSHTFHSDVRPSELRPEGSKTHRPIHDSGTDAHTSYKTSSVEYTSADSREGVKSSASEENTGRPSSFYPRPTFGHNYQPSDVPMRPFSVGTVTSAKNLTKVEYIKADCFDNHMKVSIRFNGTFNGLVYSSGYAQDSSCSYVNGSGRNHYEFFIRLNRCGTLGQQEVSDQRPGSTSRRRQERAQYLVNTVTVQYNPVIEEEIDEHFRVTCEYGYDFWKTVTFPVINVESSAAKVRTGSPVVFTLPPPQCNMEIRSGFGTAGNRVGGPVNVGDPLTLVIHMKSESTGFDILVSNCFAHNGAQKRLQLIDSNGCVVQEKLVSPFRGVSSPDRSQQVTLYSYLKAFRFTGSPALYIECDVHMCHGSCPPQRCYWRHLYKRSVDELPSETTTPSSGVMSESVSLFQALEVRHEADTPNPLALKTPSGLPDEDLICLKTAGFASIFACLLLVLFLTSSTSVCLCLRMRRMKTYVDAPDAKHFADFDGHIPFK